MRKNIKEVLIAFSEGKTKTVGTASTDGVSLFSYNMRIAKKNAKHGIDVIEYSQAPSNTTRTHIRAVKQFFAAETFDTEVSSFE